MFGVSPKQEQNCFHRIIEVVIEVVYILASGWPFVVIQNIGSMQMILRSASNANAIYLGVLSEWKIPSRFKTASCMITEVIIMVLPCYTSKRFAYVDAQK